jgi:hypothetical protein
VPALGSNNCLDIVSALTDVIQPIAAPVGSRNAATLRGQYRAAVNVRLRGAVATLPAEPPEPSLIDTRRPGAVTACMIFALRSRLVPGHGKQDQARRDEGDSPEEIEVDPAAAQEGDTNPLVDHDRDDARHPEHRERMDADRGQRDLD